MSKPKNNCYITSSDGLRPFVYSEETAVTLFGDDALEDGHYLPEELLQRVLKLQSDSEEIFAEIRKFKTAQIEEVSKKLCRRCGRWKPGVKDRTCPDCVK